MMKRHLAYCVIIMGFAASDAGAIDNGQTGRQGSESLLLGEAAYVEMLATDPVDADRERDRDPLDQGNDACPATVIGSVPYTDTGTTAGRANNWNTAASCAGGGGTSNAPDVIYSFTPPGTNTYVVSTCGSLFNTIVEVRSGGACPGATQFACGDAGCGGDAEIIVTLNGGTAYYIIIDGWGTQSGSYNLSVRGMCNVYAHTGDFIECTEPIDTSHARLDCNGGPCNVAFGGTASFTWISPGQTYFGHCFTYTRGGVSLYDTDWYRFFLNEASSVRVTVTAEFPQTISVGDTVTDCDYHSVYGSGYSCTENYTAMGPLTPGVHEFTVSPWDAAGIPTPRDYRVTLEVWPTSGCVVDTTINAPGSVSGNTQNEGNDCELEPYNDYTVRVNIAEAGYWTISGCGGSSSWLQTLYLTEDCCDANSIIASANYGCPENGGLPYIRCVYLDAGTYYATVDGDAIDEFGPFVISVEPCDCVIDGTIMAPGSFSSNTCGGGRDCDYSHAGSVDHMIRVVFPAADDWTFTLETPGWNAWPALMRECCHSVVNTLSNPMYCFHFDELEAYYKVDGYDSLACGPYTLTVTRCRERCCYGESGYQSCADTTRTACDALGGIFDLTRSCAEDPCPYIPPCPDNSLYSQPPQGTDGYLNSMLLSDLNGSTQYYDDFTGVTEPIGHIRFWGTRRLGSTPCAEDPFPVVVEFLEAGDIYPGGTVATYMDTVIGIPGEEYNGYILYEYNMALNPPLVLNEGWVGVMGNGDPSCRFYWMTSGLGTFGIYRVTDGEGVVIGFWRTAFCLGVCPPPEDLTLLAEGGDNFTVAFTAPSTALYWFYFTTSTTSIFPAGFTQFYSATLTAGPHEIPLVGGPPYVRIVMTAECTSGSAMMDSPPGRIQLSVH